MKENRRESAGGIIINTEGAIALIEQWGNSWSFPKGTLEESEDLRTAALREIIEETGLRDVEFVCELGSYERYSIGKGGVGETKEFGLKRRTFFLFRTRGGALAPQDPDGEVTAARWATPAEALELLTHPKDKEFLASVLPKIRATLQ